ncbi:MAG: hypothetical protein GX550_04450 [Syntrophomonadaceae bacterium]|jgi:hypothetical protein|nr:hypothetical protein [Syntrophomonadaceae bacterium]
MSVKNSLILLSRLGFLCLILFLVAGCSTEQNQADNNNNKASEDPVNIEAYFPLTVGSTWIYQGEGNEYASFSREVLFAKNNLAQIKEDNGGTVIAMVFQVNDEDITRIYFEGEVYNPENLLETNLPQNDNKTIIKAPIEVGTAWETSNGSSEIVDLKAKVDTPAGVFENCLHVQTTGDDYLINEFFKEGIGMVKREYITGDFQVTSSLQEYTIK